MNWPTVECKDNNIIYKVPQEVFRYLNFEVNYERFKLQIYNILLEDKVIFIK